jgi:hypothetical protein
MNTWLVVLTSSAVGVLASGVIGLIGQFFERRSRRDELLFRAAIEISQVNAERAAKGAERFTPVFELSLIERTYEILREIHKKGKMSETNKAFLMHFLKRDEGNTPKE